MTDYLATYRENSPITGYAGHQPGEKFHVGSKFYKSHHFLDGRDRTGYRPRSILDEEVNSNGGEDQQNEEGVNEEGGTINRTRTGRSAKSQSNQNEPQIVVPQIGNSYNGPVFQIPVQFVPALDGTSASLQIPINQNLLNSNLGRSPRSRSVNELADKTERLSLMDGEENEENRSGRSQKTNRTKKSGKNSAASRKSNKSRRARSEPRRKQAFARLNIPADYNSLNNGGHGYWSEGQALPNLRRHRERNGLPIHTADGAEDQEEGGQNQNRVMTTNGTPAPGYTGHMMNIPHLGIGRNFSDAARESKKMANDLKQSFTDISQADLPKTARNNSRASDRSNRSK